MLSMVSRRFESIAGFILEEYVYRLAFVSFICKCTNSKPYTYPSKMNPAMVKKRQETNDNIDISENAHDNSQIHESFNQLIIKFFNIFHNSINN